MGTTFKNVAATVLLPIGVLFAVAAAPPDGAITTVSKGVPASYRTRLVEGFTVHVDERLLGERRDAGDAALAELSSQLRQIARRLREAPLAKLRAIPIWLGLDDPVAACACYHPSPDWLEQHGFDRRKAKAVEIANAAAFVQWTHEQPWMVLHELAHGFDDLYLDPRRDEAAAGRELEELLEKARAGGRYDKVLHWDGERVRHYALQSSAEYFAEGTEAWLGTNDFFPFVKAELVEHDPELAAFLKKVWGDPIDSKNPR